MGRRRSGHRRHRYTGLRLLLISAIAFSAAICAVLLVLDFAGGVDVQKVKRQGKASVKEGKTAEEGVTLSVTQGQKAAGAILATVALIASFAGLVPLVRTRRIPKQTKWWLGLIGLALGLGLVAPIRAFLLWAARFIV